MTERLTLANVMLHAERMEMSYAARAIPTGELYKGITEADYQLKRRMLREAIEAYTNQKTEEAIEAYANQKAEEARDEVLKSFRGWRP